MLTFAQLAGQSGYLDRLRSDFAAGTYVHAYLFSGPRGTGKKSTAMLCAMTALCRGAEKPCGECGPCRRVLGGTHPDVHIIRPAGNKKTIGVDVMREALAEAEVKSFEDGAKVLLIPEADKMTVQTQNCLLKTLEEPPDKTVFFLVTDKPSALLPTIVSRCRTVRFHPLEEDQASARLAELGMDSVRARQYARLSGGCVGQALEIDGDRLETLRGITGDVFSVRNAGLIPGMTAKYKDDKEKQKLLLDTLDMAARDILVQQSGGPSLPEGLYADAVYRYAEAVPPEGGLELVQTVLQARRMSASNVTFLSIFEMILFRITEDCKKWPW